MVKISEEWVQKYQQMRKHYGEDATRKEAFEELERLVRYFELLIEVEDREKKENARSPAT